MTASPIADPGTLMSDRRAARDADFAAYLQARQASVLRTAYLLTGDRHTAEDLTQTAFAKLYLAWDRVRDQGSMDGYLRRILVNENNSLWRRGWKKREHATEELPEPTPVVDEYDDGRGAALWDLVQTLPKKARAVLVLRYYEELSEAETAEVLGVSVGTVKSQTSRALAALRERTPAHLNPADRPQTGGGAMSDLDDDLGARLTREMHRRTDGLHDAPLAFDDVRGRATSIRRRRQLATGLGVAAAVAVIVPTAMFATKGTDGDGNLPPATSSPTVIDTNTPSPDARRRRWAPTRTRSTSATCRPARRRRSRW